MVKDIALKFLSATSAPITMTLVSVSGERMCTILVNRLED